MATGRVAIAPHTSFISLAYRMARGGIEPPTRGFSVLIRPYMLD